MPEQPLYATFAVVLMISTIGTLLAVFLAKPTDMDTLVRFYQKGCPDGFGQPVKKLCEP